MAPRHTCTDMYATVHLVPTALRRVCSGQNRPSAWLQSANSYCKYAINTSSCLRRHNFYLSRFFLPF